MWDELFMTLLIEDNITEICKWLPTKDVRVVCIVNKTMNKVFSKHLLLKYKYLTQSINNYKKHCHVMYKGSRNDIMATIGVQEGLTIKTNKLNKKVFCTQNEYKIYITDERCLDAMLVTKKRMKYATEINKSHKCFCGKTLKFVTINRYKQHLETPRHRSKVAYYNVSNHNNLINVNSLLIKY